MQTDPDASQAGAATTTGDDQAYSKDNFRLVTLSSTTRPNIQHFNTSGKGHGKIYI